MFAVPEKKFYTLELFDHSMYNGSDISLDKIVTETYGRKYVGQQTGDMMSNDSYHFIETFNEEFGRDSYHTGYGYDWSQYSIDLAYGRKSAPIPESTAGECLDAWLADYSDERDYEHYRKGLTPAYMLNILVEDGHLPEGTYLLECSW